MKSKAALTTIYGLAKALSFFQNSTKFTDDYKLLETLGEGAFGVVGK